MTEYIDKILEECTLWIGETIQQADRDPDQGPDQWVSIVDEMVAGDADLNLELFGARSWYFVVKLLDIVKKQRVSVEYSNQKLVETQDNVIKLQNQLLEKKEEQISEISAAVKSTVTSTVKSEVKSFSDVIKNGTAQKSVINPVSLKNTVKQVVEQDEEDRSKNVMIFGLPDTEDEETEEVIKPVLLEIG